MAKKKSQTRDRTVGDNVEISGAGLMVETPITDTLMSNFMPYAMSVIVSRALPEIDGFKPSHRKLLYTMYLMGLLNGQRTKSANVVGQTMKLNPHGDMAIYETLVRLSRGNETLLHPYVDSKGNFGKSYSRDMAFAASRYTECKLAPISSQLFADIAKNTVDFVDNYDGTMQEPSLFPVTFPSILVNSNIGIAVGMASSICSFNLSEVCETTVALLKNPEHDITSTLKAPDFAGGGIMIYDEKAIRDVYETGKGTFRVRCKYEVVQNSIEITQIPPTTTVEAIMDKITEQIKNGKIREISEFRDETDLNGLRLTIDLKRGTDADAFMKKLYRLTPLEDNYACNFTVLIDRYPRLMGVREILTEWIRFRRGCIRRRCEFDLNGKKARLHILKGLSKILADIDKAIKIIRETKQEKEVVPNLMIGFGIDETQAEFIAEIKLRHLNREYILTRLDEIEALEKDINELNETLADEKKIDKIIMKEQAEVAKKYIQPRRTEISYDAIDEPVVSVDDKPDYPVNIFFTKEGYFKKITPLSLRMSSEHKLKENDEIVFKRECRNSSHLLFFTNMMQVYKCDVSDFDDTKASSMGDYIPSKLQMQDNEVPISTVVCDDYTGNLVFFYKSGRVSRVPLSSYETKTNRKKLQSASSPAGDLLAVFDDDNAEYAMFSSGGRMLLLQSVLIPIKKAKDTVGVIVFTQKKNCEVTHVIKATDISINAPHKFRSKTIPSSGGILRDSDIAFEEQQKFD